MLLDFFNKARFRFVLFFWVIRLFIGLYGYNVSDWIRVGWVK